MAVTTTAIGESSFELPANGQAALWRQDAERLDKNLQAISARRTIANELGAKASALFALAAAAAAATRQTFLCIAIRERNRRTFAVLPSSGARCSLLVARCALSRSHSHSHSHLHLHAQASAPAAAAAAATNSLAPQPTAGMPAGNLRFSPACLLALASRMRRQRANEDAAADDDDDTRGSHLHWSPLSMSPSGRQQPNSALLTSRAAATTTAATTAASALLTSASGPNDGRRGAGAAALLLATEARSRALLLASGRQTWS